MNRNPLKLEENRTEQREFTRLEVGDEVGILTLYRPPINAVNGPVLWELVSILEEWEKNDQVRSLVLTGGIRNAFCTGGDLNQLFGGWMRELAYDRKLELFWSFQRIYRLIESYPKPIVAAINGLAIGGGLELSLVCDYRVASELSYFSLPEVPKGIIPSLGATQRLASYIGWGRAKEMMLLGRRINAQTAWEWGLVNQVAPHRQVVTKSLEVARELARMPAPAVKALKRCMFFSRQGPDEGALYRETETFTKLFHELVKEKPETAADWKQTHWSKVKD